jgi:uncharacterized membrane protein YtjA (UPF0391 family)
LGILFLVVALVASLPLFGSAAPAAGLMY